MEQDITVRVEKAMNLIKDGVVNHIKTKNEFSQEIVDPLINLASKKYNVKTDYLNKIIGKHSSLAVNWGYLSIKY